MNKSTPNQSEPKLESFALVRIGYRAIPFRTTALELEVPEYIGKRRQVGILRRMRSGSEQWCFVHRLDNRPCFDRWFSEVDHFQNGYARVRDSDRWWFVNEQGKDACRHRFLDVASADQEGFAWVMHYSMRTKGGKRFWVPYHIPTGKLWAKIEEE